MVFEVVSWVCLGLLLRCETQVLRFFFAVSGQVFKCVFCFLHKAVLFCASHSHWPARNLFLTAGEYSILKVVSWVAHC